MEQNPAMMLSETVPHELAHIITDRLYGKTKQVHGKEWKSIALALYGKNDTYHGFTTLAAQKRSKK